MLRSVNGVSSWVSYNSVETVLMLTSVVVGEKEMNDEAVNIRNRDDEVQGREETVSVKDAVEKLVRLQKSRASVAKLE